MELLKLWLPYLITVNLMGLVFMGIDKRNAKKQEWRIPERTLWGIAILGGALGVLLGMRIFHHKTKHISFKIGIPLLIIVHIIAVIFLMS